jgi:hypothetical protein
VNTDARFLRRDRRAVSGGFGCRWWLQVLQPQQRLVQLPAAESPPAPATEPAPAAEPATASAPATEPGPATIPATAPAPADAPATAPEAEAAPAPVAQQFPPRLAWLAFRRCLVTEGQFEGVGALKRLIWLVQAPFRRRLRLASECVERFALEFE